jgi:hypothetical protein
MIWLGERFWHTLGVVGKPLMSWISWRRFCNFWTYDEFEFEDILNLKKYLEGQIS